MKKYLLWKKIILGISAMSLVCGGILTACSKNKSENTAIATSVESQKTEDTSRNKASNGSSVVYMTKDISPKGLDTVYEALGRKATGK